jgi:hypothetical protein
VSTRVQAQSGSSPGGSERTVPGARSTTFCLRASRASTVVERRRGQAPVTFQKWTGVRIVAGPSMLRQRTTRVDKRGRVGKPIG